MVNIKLFDTVEVVKDTGTEAIPPANLKSGLRGTVLDIYHNPSFAYGVEFCNKDGETLEYAILAPDQIKKVVKPQ